MPTRNQIENSIKTIVKRNRLKEFSEETQEMYNNHEHDLETFYNGNIEEYVNRKTSDYTYDLEKAKKDMETWAPLTAEGYPILKKKLYEADRDSYYKELYSMGLMLPSEAKEMVNDGTLDLSNVDRKDYPTLKDKVENPDPKIAGFMEKINKEIDDKESYEFIKNHNYKKGSGIQPKDTDAFKDLSAVEQSEVTTYLYYKDEVKEMEANLMGKKRAYELSYTEYMETIDKNKEAKSTYGTELFNKAKDKHEQATRDLLNIDNFQSMHEGIGSEEISKEEEEKAAQDYLSEKQAEFDKKHGPVGKFFASFLPTWMYSGAKEYQEIQDIKTVMKEKNIPESPAVIKEENKPVREKVNGNELDELAFETSMTTSRDREKDEIIELDNPEMNIQKESQKEEIKFDSLEPDLS